MKNEECKKVVEDRNTKTCSDKILQFRSNSPKSLFSSVC